MTSPEDLLFLLDLNDYTLKKQIDGLTHEEALLQLAVRGNSLNWVVGHVVEARN